MNGFAKAFAAAWIVALAAWAHADAGSVDGTWSDLAPPERGGHVAIYDPLRDRMVIFGGVHPAGRGSGNDTWSLSLTPGSTWTRVITQGATPPPWSTNMTALHDPIRDRMLVLLGGGHFGVWALSLATMTWESLAPIGTSPIVSYRASCVYDAARDRVIVFGGDESCLRGPCPHNDVWSLTLAGTPEWSELTVDGPQPSARYGHTAVYDPVRDRMIVFAGFGEYYEPVSDAWSLDLGGIPAWHPIVPSGVAPPVHDGYVAMYEAADDRMLVTGATNGPANPLWSLSLGGSPAWASQSPTGTAPRDRRGASFVHDTMRGRLVLHGGSSSGPQSAGETWALQLGPSPSWSGVMSLPPGRHYLTTVLDDATERMVVFGGMQDLGTYLNDTWVLDLAGQTGWSALSPSGPKPGARWGHSAILDRARHRMVVFGGIGASSFNDVWALGLGSSPAWSPIVPTGTPPAKRNGHVAVYDPIGDRMVIFGGAGDTLPQTTYNDTWALSFTPIPSWERLEPGGPAPTPRFWMAATYDTRRRRMLMFGAVPIGSGGELWSLSLDGVPTWTQIVLPDPPPARFLSSAVFDPAGDRLIVFGGLSDTHGEGNAAWALSLGEPLAWTRLSPEGGLPAERIGHGAVFDTPRNRMVVFGGSTPGMGINTVPYDDAWVLAWEPQAVGVPPREPTRAFGPIRTRPNPASRSLRVSFSLPDDGPATLELLDVTGRRLLSREVSAQPAGPVEVELDRDVAGLAPGVYVVRLRQGGRVAATKVCVVR